MLEFLITNQNFNQIKSRAETTLVNITTNLCKKKNKITISSNSLAPFAIYKWEQNGNFAISNRLENISEYIAKFGCELTYTPIESKYLSKTDVNHNRDCNVQKITKWSKVIIDSKGEIQITPPPGKQLFSIELTSKRGVKNLLKWLKKYLIIAKQEIEKDNFIPTLTGGLDTRTLTWFWRDTYKGNEYYLKAVKADGKNCVEKGKVEIDISNQILDYFGKKLVRLEEYSAKISFSGMFTENARIKKNLNDLDFVYDFIAFHFEKKNMYFNLKYTSKVYPFVDNLYLQLRHPETHYMRTLLALLLCPDLLDIQLYGFSGMPPYMFKEEFAYQIPKVEEFIAKYNLRERVAKIKAKVLKQ